MSKNAIFVLNFWTKKMFSRSPARFKNGIEKIFGKNGRVFTKNRVELWFGSKILLNIFINSFFSGGIFDNLLGIGRNVLNVGKNLFGGSDEDDFDEYEGSAVVDQW